MINFSACHGCGVTEALNGKWEKVGTRLATCGVALKTNAHAREE